MAKAKKKTLGDFRASHDKDFVIPARIDAGLKKLGKDGWEYEGEFMRMCNVGTVDFARYRERFLDFCIVIREGKHSRRVWAGSKVLAEKMRAMT